tara:strand:- start:290 stop:1480 length:1191 start_codon:yes stop_codon:yes gene_type:complete
MLTKNIRFEGFGIKKNKQKIKSQVLKALNFHKKTKLIKSLSQDYQLDFDNKIIQSYKKYSNFNLIGMGGSSLGAKAIYNFMKPKIKKNFSFIDNLNSRKNFQKTKKKIVNIVISKSGNTLETISNYSLLKNKNKNRNIFICENSDNYIKSLANKLNCLIINHKNYIGGRYSVLSEVGMLPAIFMGLKPEKFKNLNYLMKNKNFLNSLIDSAVSTNYFLKKKKYNSIILNYDELSHNLFEWYQQLIAESLGKNSKGILPITSNMPRDNHSMMQLYLDGPKNSFFTFFNVVDYDNNKINNSELLSSRKYLKNKSLYQIKYAQKIATENVFKKRNIPFRSFNVLRRSEEALGELFTFFILETILLGELTRVNPFDQPSVELIKTETNRILKTRIFQSKS